MAQKRHAQQCLMWKNVTQNEGAKRKTLQQSERHTVRNGLTPDNRIKQISNILSSPYSIYVGLFFFSLVWHFIGTNLISKRLNVVQKVFHVSIT